MHSNNENLLNLGADWYSHNDEYLVDSKLYSSDLINRVVPFFSVRKLRVIYHELYGQEGFKYQSFESFKQDVLSSLAPQIELSKWESLASRR